MGTDTVTDTAALQIACPLCQGTRSRFEARRGAHRLYRCVMCDLVYADSLIVPETLYETAYDTPDHSYRTYHSQAEASAAGRAHVAWAWRQFFKRSSAKAGHTLLDIGCSTGSFLLVAKKRGWSVMGTDLSKTAAGIAAELVGAPTWALPIERAPIPPGSLDAITTWEVIEHVAKPLDFMRTIFSLIRPGGAVALSTPNWQSPWERASTQPIRHPPYHVTYWTPQTIGRLLEATGFVEIETARKPIAWSEELGKNYHWHIPMAIARSVLLDQKGNRLFAFARRPR